MEGEGKDRKVEGKERGRELREGRREK